MKKAIREQITIAAKTYATANPPTANTTFCVMTFGETMNGVPQYVIAVRLGREQQTVATIPAAGAGSDSAVQKVFYIALCDAWDEMMQAA